jgi:hypothetical protein
MTSKTTAPEPHHLTIQEFVRQYGTSRTATYRLLRQGALRARKRGRRTLICNAAQWPASLPDYRPQRPEPSKAARSPRQRPELVNRRSRP